VWFIAAITAAILFYIVALVHVIRSNLGHWYSRLPSAAGLFAHSASLDAYFGRNPHASGSAATDFADFIRRRMVEATTRNEYANQSRAARHYSAMRAMSFCVVFTLTASAPLLWNPLFSEGRSEPLSQQQELTGGAMSDAQKPKPAPEPAKPANPAPTLPTKPAEPENVLFRGTQQPPKPPTLAPNKPAAPKPQK
jgi:hypothetical protein